jgi:hypothetical protein
LKRLLSLLKPEARSLVQKRRLRPPLPLKLLELLKLWGLASRIMRVWELWVARGLAQGLARVLLKQVWQRMLYQAAQALVERVLMRRK